MDRQELGFVSSDWEWWRMQVQSATESSTKKYPNMKFLCTFQIGSTKNADFWILVHFHSQPKWTFFIFLRNNNYDVPIKFNSKVLQTMIYIIIIVLFAVAACSLLCVAASTRPDYVYEPTVKVTKVVYVDRPVETRPAESTYTYYKS